MKTIETPIYVTDLSRDCSTSQEETKTGKFKSHLCYVFPNGKARRFYLYLKLYVSNVQMKYKRNRPIMYHKLY
jgi:hypothetical protein